MIEVRSPCKRAKNQKLPPGWTQKRIKEVIKYYDNQTEDEQAAEYEAALAAKGHTVMVVPTELVPAIRKLLGRHSRMGLQAAAKTRR